MRDNSCRAVSLWRSDAADVGGGATGDAVSVANQVQCGGLSEWVGYHTGPVWGFTPYEIRSALAPIENIRIALQEKMVETELVKGQMEIDKTEAQHPSVFVAGWRPAIGWIGALALLYQFIGYPLLIWGWKFFQAWHWVPLDMTPPPVLPADQLWVILTGMLGIAGLRSFDKLKGTQTDQVGNSKDDN